MFITFWRFLLEGTFKRGRRCLQTCLIYLGKTFQCALRGKQYDVGFLNIKMQPQYRAVADLARALWIFIYFDWFLKIPKLWWLLLESYLRNWSIESYFFCGSLVSTILYYFRSLVLGLFSENWLCLFAFLSKKWHCRQI